MSEPTKLSPSQSVDRLSIAVELLGQALRALRAFQSPPKLMATIETFLQSKGGKIAMAIIIRANGTKSELNNFTLQDLQKAVGGLKGSF